MSVTEHCVICRTSNEPLYRISATGQPAVWACKKHLAQTDAAPVDPAIAKIVDAIMNASRKP